MSLFLKLFKTPEAGSYPGVLIPLQQVQRYQPVESEPETKPPDDGAADEEDDQPLLPGDTWDLGSLKTDIEKDISKGKDTPYESPSHLLTVSFDKQIKLVQGNQELSTERSKISEWGDISGSFSLCAAWAGWRTSESQ